MAAWSDVGVAAVGGAAGIIGAAVGAVVQAQLGVAQRREERQSAARDARLDRVSRVLGPIQTLLIDLLPARAMSTFSEVGLVGAHRQDRWLPLRDEWEVVIVMEPTAEVRDKMRRLEVAIENVYHRLGLTLTPSAQHERTDGRTFYDDAEQHHTDAVRLAEEVAADLHRPSSPTHLGLGRRPRAS
jgi:hypothetical protein